MKIVLYPIIIFKDVCVKALVRLHCTMPTEVRKSERLSNNDFMISGVNCSVCIGWPIEVRHLLMQESLDVLVSIPRELYAQC